MIGKLDADLSFPVRQSAYCSVAKEHMGIATAAEDEEGSASLVENFDASNMSTEASDGAILLLVKLKSSYWVLRLRTENCSLMSVGFVKVTPAGRTTVTP